MKILRKMFLWTRIWIGLALAEVCDLRVLLLLVLLLLLIL